VNVNEQAQIQLPAISLKELIQPSAMTALDQPFVFLAVIMRLLSQSPAHSARRSHRRWCVGPTHAAAEATSARAPFGRSFRSASVRIDEASGCHTTEIARELVFGSGGDGGLAAL